jgi:hypothetical protein
VKSITTSRIRTKACMTAKGDAPMPPARHRVDFPYMPAELEAIFRYAREHDMESGGRYDARAACILFWSHHWLHPATREASEIIGGLYVRWGDTPALWEIETEEGFSLMISWPNSGAWNCRSSAT